MRVPSVGTLLRSVAAVLAASVVALTAATGGATASPRLSESRLDELLQLPHWREVARRLPREAALVRACLKGSCANGPALRLAQLVAAGAGPDALTQLRRVHETVNRQPYREDADQFGREDLWQSPLAFVDRGGDCEDFAIAKYFVLRLLGVPASDLRIAVLTGDGRAEVHAVLLARAGGEWQVLDNREAEPRPLRSYRGWIPQYAVTETAGFRYRAMTRAPAQAPAQR
jgi:predicted transglutaminase-like cysteine proteinase